jgi:hypothetical protein
MDGLRLRVVHGAEGSRQAITLEGRSCRQLKADVQPTAWRVNRVRDFSGFLEAECTSDSGLEVRVHVRFTHCH